MIDVLILWLMLAIGISIGLFVAVLIVAVNDE